MERRKFLFLFIGSVACVCPIIFGCLFGIPKSNKVTAPENVIENSTNQPRAYSNLYFPVNRSDIPLTSYVSGNGTSFHDVVIIGAGLSGLSAALKLCQEMPDLDILLLEASNTPGGRIFSTQMRNNTSYIDVGARWLIGSDQNALQALANLAHVHRARERRVTRMEMLRSMFSLSLCSNTTSSESGLCTQSADEFDDVMLGGAHKIVEYLVTLLAETSCHVSIQFNSKVSNITTTDSIASVRTEDGRVYPASYIISSIPAGVLQESSVSFQPGLPHVIHQAIQNLHVIRTSVIHVALSESIPSMREPYYSVGVDQEGDKHLDVVNLMSFTGDNLLALYANHRLSIDLEKISDEDIMRMISNALQRAFGTAPSISNFLVSHWGLHPYVRGAYTTLSDCSTPQDRATLREPIGGRLVFTGEWVASVSPGTLTGAFLSGIESALRILEAFDDQTVGMIGRSYGSNAPPPDIEETEFNPAIANNISIIGNVGRKPEMKYLESGSKVTNFPVAFTDRRDGDTQWFDVEAWDELADIANLYVDKGERVALQGRLKVQDWTDREGNTRKSLRIVAQQIKKVKRNSMYGTSQMDAQRQVFSGQDEQQQPRQAMVRNTSAVQQEQSPMTFEELWMNFFENTSGWYDNRERKANGEINPKSPDFKRIEGGRDAPALWIESKTTPAWVKAELSKLDRLQNDIPPF